MNYWLGLVKTWWDMLLEQRIVLVAVGGAVGTCARYWLGKWFNAQAWTHGFPYGTLVVNVSGSFILGAAVLVIHDRLPPQYGNLYLLIGTGFCGGYTTFSTFEYETFRLVQDGSWGRALANVLASVVAGFAAVVLAARLINGVFPRG